MRKQKRQTVKKLMQCAAIIAAGVLAIILFMLAIWYRGKNVKEFIGTLESSDRLRIIEGKAEVYVGYLAAFKPFADHEISEEYRKYSGHEVKKFRAVPEITHRRWKELGLMKPLEPDQTAQYKFSDLQMSLYYTIYI